MTLQLIGAGLPRTGTSSLREALQHLLGGPVYHMTEVFAHPEHAPTWVRAIHGDPPVWEDFLAGYAAGVDAPLSTCWRDLATAYPDAPMLLSHRGSAEVWYRSMEPTVLAVTQERLRAHHAGLEDEDPTARLLRSIFQGVFADPFDRADVMAGYDRRLAHVRAEVAPGRLVEWQPGDGWEPLCQALGLSVPDLPFPHENTTADFVARVEESKQQS